MPPIEGDARDHFGRRFGVGEQTKIPPVCTGGTGTLVLASTGNRIGRFDAQSGRRIQTLFEWPGIVASWTL